MEFFDKYGYTKGLIFPTTALMTDLIQRGRDKTLRDADYSALLGAMNGLYHPEDYEKSFQKVVASLATLEKAIPVFQEYKIQVGIQEVPNLYRATDLLRNRWIL